MLIELDLNEAKRLKITVNQFILITLLINNHDIKSLLDVIPIGETDINNLIEKNILTPESKLDPKDFSRLVIDESFKDTVTIRDFFSEFSAIFPSYVKRPDGIKQYLRLNPSRCRKYYTDIVGQSKTKHEYMMSCLKFEVTNRRQNNSLQYMKTMPKWFTSEEWLLYEEFLKDTEVQKTTEKIYGTDIE